MTNKTLNIGFDAKRYFFNFTGLGNYSRHIIDGLSDLFPDNTYQLFSPKEVDNIRVIHPKNHFLGKSIWRSFGVVKSSEYQSLDIYHGLSNELPFFNRKVKMVVTIHDLIFKHLPQTQPFFNRIIYDFKSKKACLNADKIVATSEFTKRDIVNWYGINPNKIEVIYQDCHPQFYSKSDNTQGFDMESPYILCVGTIEERKNQLLLLKAFSKIDTDYKLIFLGRKSTFFKNLEQFISKNPKLKESVLFLDKISYQDFPSYYRNAQLFVYPSTIEGFGIPVLEAMNCGVPVLTTKGTVMEEIAGDTAWYSENNLESLTERLRFLISNPLESKALVQKAQERALIFRKEINLPKLMQLYRQL